MRLGTVILGAGASSRMGRPKLLLDWGCTTVLGQALGVWLDAGAEQIAVVMASGDEAISRELDRLGFEANRIINPRPGRGMFSSIQCAARWRGWRHGLSHFAIALGDQPHLQPDTLRRLLNFARRHPESICQPGREGRAKHPVVLPRPAFDELGRTRVATLRQFLKQRAPLIALCELADPGLDLDIDEPADYERARRRCFGD
jgi:molybdenum cofactor cytidylyltransferase